MKYVSAASIAVLLVLLPGSTSRAINRVSVFADRWHLFDPTWTNGADCEIRYYNTCTGWVWVWYGAPEASRWSIGDRVGVVVDGCGTGSRLTNTWVYFYSTVPYWYGYTNVSVQAVDAAGCPSGMPLAQQIRAPVSGWNLTEWDVEVPDRFAIVQELRSDFHSIYSQLTLDHPGPGGTGPPDCGNCYPASRVTRSWFWGRAVTPLCPGLPFFDGTCNAELVVDIGLDVAVNLEPSTWGTIKALYR